MYVVSSILNITEYQDPPSGIAHKGKEKATGGKVIPAGMKRPTNSLTSK
jgi:hypothetical protein